jgi:mRNA interferase RelE/StbE
VAYNLKFTDIALANLKHYPKKDQIRIIEQIEKLALNPLEKSNVKKLVNFDFSYRLRVGDYRVFFEKDDGIKIIDVIDILRRDKAY